MRDLYYMHSLKKPAKFDAPRASMKPKNKPEAN